MIRYFDYSIPRKDVLPQCRSILESLGYSIEIYSPEGEFILTRFRNIKKDFRRYQYAVAVQVEDLIQVTVTAERYVFRRGSEKSIGGESMVEAQIEDRLPYMIQKNIFQPLVKAYQRAGFKEVTRQDVSLSEIMIDEIG